MISLWRSLRDRFREKRRSRARRTVQALVARYQVFRSLLDDNSRAVDLLTEIDLHLRSREGVAERGGQIRELLSITGEMAEKLDYLDGSRHSRLLNVHDRIETRLKAILSSLPEPSAEPPCLNLEDVLPHMVPAVGKKAATLARLGNDRGYSVPGGFVVTVTACREFLRSERLWNRLALLQQYQLSGESVPADVVEKIRERIAEVPLPKDLGDALAEAGGRFLGAGRGLAVRSSSRVEDGLRHSFAGQFVTVLNVVDQAGLEEAFRKVVASAFSSRSLAYRRQAGFDMFDFDMAVLCVEMIPSRAAGVLLTRNPGSSDGTMMVSAVYGLGEAAVSGSSQADLYVIDRTGRIDPRRTMIAKKTTRLVCLLSGGIKEETVEPQLQGEPALKEGELAVLAGWGRELEALEGIPQDIEWAVGESGEFFLLQARPQGSGTRPADLPEGSPSLASGAVRASGGRATGMVCPIRRRKDLQTVGEVPSVLVMHQSLPDAAAVIDRVAAIVVDLGNPTDHLSLVAREKGIPMLCGLGDATSRFSPGIWLTVDGDRGTVQEAMEEAIDLARQEHLERKEKPAVGRRPADPEAEIVRELILPLNLTDAFGPTFTIAECRSLHDIVRYVHEKAVLAMFSAGDDALERGGLPVRIVDLDVPFIVNVIDLGGGLTPTEGYRRRVPPDEVRSVPFRALLDGIMTKGLNWGPAGAVNIGSVMSSWISDSSSARPVGLPNYAIISLDYLSLNARMDFHFTMIDAVCGTVAQSNYVRFRFKGGGTLPVQRHRRARCIGTILERHDFFTSVRDDLVTASLQAVPAEHITTALVTLGRLLGFTRLLDAVMREDDDVEKIAGAFMEGDYAMKRGDR